MKKRNKIYEGEIKEQYKAKREKWVLLLIFGFFMPLLLACLPGWYQGKSILPDLFNNGDVLLSLFTVTVPATIDVFESKQHKDSKLEWTFAGFLILILIQTGAYILIKNNEKTNFLTQNIITSLAIVVSSLLLCIYSLKRITIHSIEKGNNKTGNSEKSTAKEVVTNENK